MSFRARFNDKLVANIPCDIDITVEKACIKAAEYFEINKTLSAYVYGSKLPDNDLLFNNIVYSDIVYLYEDEDEHKEAEIKTIKLSDDSVYSNNKSVWKVFITLSLHCIINGVDVSFEDGSCVETVKNTCQELCERHNVDPKYRNFNVYLPGGILYTSGTLNEFARRFPDAPRHLYVVNYPSNDLQMDETFRVTEICPIDSVYSQAFSSCKWTIDAPRYTAASLLVYLRNNGPGTQNFLSFLCKYYRFSPLLVSIYSLMHDKNFQLHNLFAISVPLTFILNHYFKNGNIWDDAPLLFSTFAKQNHGDYENFNVYSTDYFKKFTEDNSASVINSDIVVFKEDLQKHEMFTMNLPEFTQNELESYYQDSFSFQKINQEAVSANTNTSLINLPNDVIGTFIRIKRDMVSLYNPKEKGLACISMDKFSEINGIKVCEKNKREVIIICVDNSSLSSKVFSDNDSIIDVEKEAIMEFLDRTKKSNIGSRKCLVKFDKKVVSSKFAISVKSIASEVSELRAVEKEVDLYEYINEAYELADRARSIYSPSNIRVIVFTAGCVVNERMAIEPKKDVIVDIVYLRTSSEEQETYDQRAYVLANMSGGLYLAPTTKEQVMSIIDNEAFFNSKRKAGKFRPIDYSRSIQNLFNDRYSNESKSFEKKLIDSIEYQPQDQPFSCMPLKPIRNAVELLSDDVMNKYPAIVEQIKIVAATQNIGYTVFLNENMPFTWRVIFKGPINSEYKKNYYYLIVHIPKQYPNKQLTVRFVSPIYHLFVTEHGELAPGLQTKLSELSSIDDILTEISNYLAMTVKELKKYSDDNGGIYGSYERKRVYDDALNKDSHEIFEKILQEVNDPVIAPKKSAKEWTDNWNIDYTPVEIKSDIKKYINIPKNIIDPETKQIIRTPVKGPDNKYHEKTGEYSDLPTDIEMQAYINVWRTITNYKK